LWHGDFQIAPIDVILVVMEVAKFLGIPLDGVQVNRYRRGQTEYNPSNSKDELRELAPYKGGYYFAFRPGNPDKVIQAICILDNLTFQVGPTDSPAPLVAVMHAQLSRKELIIPEIGSKAWDTRDWLLGPKFFHEVMDMSYYSDLDLYPYRARQANMPPGVNYRHVQVQGNTAAIIANFAQHEKDMKAYVQAYGRNAKHLPLPSIFTDDIPGGPDGRAYAGFSSRQRRFGGGRKVVGNKCMFVSDILSYSVAGQFLPAVCAKGKGKGTEGHDDYVW
jgi:hypothetical protein